MAAKIDYIIPSQRFELFRDTIGLIIAQEFAKQKTLTSDTDFDAGVWIERFISFDAATELPAVNVSYKQTVYSTQDAKSKFGDNLFTIEVTSKGYNTTTSRADLNAAKTLHKLLGKISYIFSSAEYTYLGLPLGVVMQRMVREIKIYPPDPVYNPIHSGDELSTVSGRIVLSIKAAEEVGDMEGILITDIFTTMTIDETDKGYKINILNT